MYRKLPPCSFFRSISGIAHEAKQIAGFYFAPFCDVRIGIQMCIIALCSVGCTYTDPESAKFQPSDVFNDPVCHTHYRKYAAFAFIRHDVRTFMPPLPSICSFVPLGILD